MPITLRHLWSGWTRAAHAMGNFQARVIMTLFYGVAVVPIGAVARLLSDPLRRRGGSSPSYWLTRQPADASVEAAAREF